MLCHKTWNAKKKKRGIVESSNDYDFKTWRALKTKFEGIINVLKKIKKMSVCHKLSGLITCWKSWEPQKQSEKKSINLFAKVIYFTDCQPLYLFILLLSLGSWSWINSFFFIYLCWKSYFFILKKLFLNSFPSYFAFLDKSTVLSYVKTLNKLKNKLRNCFKDFKSSIFIRFRLLNRHHRRYQMMFDSDFGLIF